ncbi:MAG: hypothetical protein JNL08_03140 [Planctomycetes bacterium]|nr:hypothetical protein [Planctomycetota bacterium]
MFDRFIRLAKARKALRDRRFEEVLGLCADPLIRDDRRTADLRRAAVAELLARAERHLAAADLTAARADAQRVAALAGEAEAAALLRRIDAALSGQEAASDLARRTLAEARRLAEAGETAAAAALLATIDGGAMLLEHRQLEQLLRERAQKAAALAEQAHAALRGGDAVAAAGVLARGRALDRDGAALQAVAAQVAQQLARQVAADVEARLADGAALAAAECLRGARDLLPAADGDAFAAVRQRLAAGLGNALQAAGSLDAALDLVAAGRRAGVELPAHLAELAAAVVGAAAARRRDDDGAAARHLAAVAARVDAAGLQRLAQAQAAAASADEQVLGSVRERIARGELAAARTELLLCLATDPDHAAARRELALVEQGLADLADRLAAARAALQAARLREACTLALALVASDHVGADAQRLVADARARMALVDRGVDEIRVALHGRLTAGVEGVRHCLRRLQELAKVQVDHADLPELQRAVEAEIEALGHCEAAAAALDRRALDDAEQQLGALRPLGSRLLARDRLDARIGSLADKLLAAGDQALLAGDLSAAERCAVLFADLQPQHSEYAARAAELRAGVDRQRTAAAALVAEAEQCLARRELDAAERLVESALAKWRHGGDAQRLAAELAGLRRQTATLQRVEAMARDRDFVGAQQKLAAMPPTQPMLRTRIYDMKRDLARAQGLDGAFLLRVDEGGEHLVLRGESVSIGNIQKRRADLPVLASLASRHAAVQRSMSFHGGMQDSIVAEEGEVRVAGRPVPSHVLHHGDRVQLGAAFGFVYQRPSERSLSSLLVLQSGFQVAGTDRVLLLKDRGRDGRLLLGAGRDVHVRVARATSEVEVYATNTGQMRVHCAVGGTIDGVEFRGEHPIAAGQLVEAAGISFVLYPWHPAA